MSAFDFAERISHIEWRLRSLRADLADIEAMERFPGKAAKLRLFREGLDRIEAELAGEKALQVFTARPPAEITMTVLSPPRIIRCRIPAQRRRR